MIRSIILCAANAADSATYGIHELTNIEGFFASTQQIFKSGDLKPPSIGGNNNASADIALDWAGNIIWFENSNEEIFMIAPPRQGSSITLTTRGYDTIFVATALSVGSNNNVPAEFSLHQNYPNPFNPATTIKYQIPLKTLYAEGIPSGQWGSREGEGARVTLKVYDALGREVATLVNEQQEAGNYSVEFNASQFSSGIYFYTLRSGNFVETRKMIVTK